MQGGGCGDGARGCCGWWDPGPAPPALGAAGGTATVPPSPAPRCPRPWHPGILSLAPGAPIPCPAVPPSPPGRGRGLGSGTSPGSPGTALRDSTEGVKGNGRGGSWLTPSVPCAPGAGVAVTPHPSSPPPPGRRSPPAVRGPAGAGAGARYGRPRPPPPRPRPPPAPGAGPRRSAAQRCRCRCRCPSPAAPSPPVGDAPAAGAHRGSPRRPVSAAGPGGAGGSPHGSRVGAGGPRLGEGCGGAAGLLR